MGFEGEGSAFTSLFPRCVFTVCPPKGQLELQGAQFKDCPTLGPDLSYDFTRAVMAMSSRVPPTTRRKPSKAGGGSADALQRARPSIF